MKYCDSTDINIKISARDQGIYATIQVPVEYASYLQTVLTIQNIPHRTTQVQEWREIRKTGKAKIVTTRVTFNCTGLHFSHIDGFFKAVQSVQKNVMKEVMRVSTGDEKKIKAAKDLVRQQDVKAGEDFESILDREVMKSIAKKRRNKVAEITIKINPGGAVFFLYSDNHPLRQMGHFQMIRASSVEWNAVAQKWFIRMPSGNLIGCLQGYYSRLQAIADEVTILNEMLADGSVAQELGFSLP